jgi:2-dehydropantoate 2-reductase
MRFIIYGAGGIGGTIGAELHKAGEEVILIARGDHLTAMQRDGLRYETPHEQINLPIPSVGHPNEIDFGDGDVVVTTMKSQHTRDALEDLRAAAGADIPVICCQNGVANERIALRCFRHVYGMVVYLPAELLTPGVVQTHSAKLIGILDAGCYPRGVDARIEAVAKAFQGANFGCEPTDDIMPWKYGKLIQNTRNALGAACPRGDLQQVLADRLWGEAMAAFDAAGIAYKTPDDIRERRKGLMEMAEINGVARQGGSTWQSLMNGRGDIETDYLNGEIVLIGREFGVPTPANEVMQQVANELLQRGGDAKSIPLEEVAARIESWGGAAPRTQ